MNQGMVKPSYPAPVPADQNDRFDIYGNTINSSTPTAMFQGTTLDRNAGNQNADLAPGYTVIHETDNELVGYNTFQNEIKPENDEEDDLAKRLNDLKY